MNSKFPDVHPDRLALVALLNTLPFVGETLHIGWEVSQRFLGCYKDYFSNKNKHNGRGILNQLRENLQVGMLFHSVGVQIQLQHWLSCHTPQNQYSCCDLRANQEHFTTVKQHLSPAANFPGWGIMSILSNQTFEYLGQPIGFPTDLSVSTPAILIAESRGFESIAFGTILESSFGTSGKSFRNYSESSHYRLWARMFDSVGLGYSLPVAGISEVASSIICRNHPIGRVHQSCIRGKWGDPCEKCWKCFRKLH